MRITQDSSKDAIITSSLEYIDYLESKHKKAQEIRNKILLLFLVFGFLYII